MDLDAPTAKLIGITAGQREALGGIEALVHAAGSSVATPCVETFGDGSVGVEWTLRPTGSGLRMLQVRVDEAGHTRWRVERASGRDISDGHFVGGVPPRELATLVGTPR